MAADYNRAEPSRSGVGLDTQRAQSSQQHVRALNTQFASWVQSQLQNHPDELWEDGVQHYLTHASHITDKFRDVVDWLKANAAKSSEPFSGIGPSSRGNGNESVFGTKTNDLKYQLPEKGGVAQLGLPQRSIERGSVFGINSNESKFQLPEKSGIAQADSASGFAKSWNTDSTPRSTEGESIFGTNSNVPKFQIPEASGFAQVGSTSSFGSSWSSSPAITNQTPFSYGSQNLATTNRDTSVDADHEDELEQPSSPSVKKSEEKGIIVVHEVKCKLYVKSTDPGDKDTWKNKGMGQLAIKCKEGVSKATKESKPTVVMRNDVGKLLLNALIYPGIKTNVMKNAVAAIFHTSGDAIGDDGGTNDSVVARTYLMRTKTEEDRDKLAAAIQEYSPTTNSSNS